MAAVKAKTHSAEFEQFDAGMRKLLALPREVFQKRLDEFKNKPGSRGPKRKVKRPVSHGPADAPQA
jgi:hypothetical protein